MPQRTFLYSRTVLLKISGWSAIVVLFSCGSPPQSIPAPAVPEQSPVEVPTQEVEEAQPTTELPPIGPALIAQTEDEAWVERTLSGLTLRQKIGQLIMPWVLGDFAPEGSPSHDRILEYIEDQGIGGVIMSVGSPTEVAAKLNDFQAHSNIPLMVAADLETGAGFRMRGAVQMPGTIELGGATDFPSLMAVGATADPQLAYEMGRITAREARAVGIHIPFAPVLDVNNNPDNPIINVRSFGENPEEVAGLGAAFVRGVQENGAIATGKHFPGHGDTETDSHLGLPSIPHSRARMDSVELFPFRHAIEAGMGAVMTAHISVPSLDGGVGDPSTLSSAVLTDLLRGEMEFDGLLFTDAMDMSAISRGYGPEEASVRAIEAGADVILMPPSVERAVEGIAVAVESGRIDASRIDTSVRRILETKKQMGLDMDRVVQIDQIGQVVGIPAHTQVAAEIAERSITLLHNGGNLLPLLGTRSARVMSVSFRRTSDVLAGRYFNARLRQTYPRLTTAGLDVDSGPALYESLLRQARQQALVILSTYVTAFSQSGSLALPEEVVDFAGQLTEIGVPHIVVSFGNPYLITELPDVRAYMLAWSGSEVSQTAAAQALFGEIEISGRVPTRIPPLYEMGDGIMIPKKLTGNDRD